MSGMQSIGAAKISVSLVNEEARRIETANFELLLAASETRNRSGGISARTQFYGFVETLLEHIASPLNGVAAPSQATLGFSYTPSFAATFGLSGPLPEYIALASNALQLNTTQRIAFQDIAVRNKDATRTPATIEKIAEELRQAGIGRMA